MFAAGRGRPGKPWRGVGLHGPVPLKFGAADYLMMPSRGPANSMKDTLTGVSFACLSTSIGGMTVALTRLIIDQTDPLSLAFVRYGMAAVILLVIMMARRRVARMAQRDVMVIALLGIFMYAGFPYCMARALEDTTAARGALLFAAMPLITNVLGALFRIERLTVLRSVASVVAIAGVATALGEHDNTIAPNALHGDAFMFLGILSAATFNVFSKQYLIRYGSLPVMVCAMLVGVSILFFMALAFGGPFSGSLDFDIEGWFVVLLLAVPGGALMLFSWGRALQLITPTQAAITVGLNPLTAILLGAWMLSEPITPNILIGFVMIMAAIVLANLKRPSFPPGSQRNPAP